MSAARALRIARYGRRVYEGLARRLSGRRICGHRRFDMGRARPNTAKPNPGNQSDASTETIGKDSDTEFCLIEIARALARAAAREDHRKAL